jgi:glycosyltransferase involved in cell wall biosynthesis
VNNKNLPKITIITPVKNAVNTIEKAILSLVAQNYPNLEYIVIDGASTDGTIEIIKKYKDHISYFESYDDKNNVIAIIKGLEKSTGEIITTLNADDFYEPETLQKIGEEFLKKPDYDIISCWCRVLIENKGKQTILEENHDKEMLLDRNTLIQCYAPNARFFKRDVFRKIGMPRAYDDKNRSFISNDAEFLMKCIFAGLKNYTIQHMGYNYLSHPKSLTFSNSSLATQKRLAEDKIYIAKLFLKSSEFNIPLIWHKNFIKWKKKYRAFLVVANITEKNWKDFRKNFILGIKENNPLGFYFYVIKTIIRKRNLLKSYN